MEQTSFDDLLAVTVPAPVPAPADAPEPEEWREVEGFPNYLVSSLGRVYSIPRTWSRGGIAALSPLRDGRLAVMLQGAAGARRNALVHRLVARAFLGPCPEGQEVCHGPLGLLDNRASQIYYGTHQRNVGPDKRRDGTQVFGDGHYNSKLTSAIVGECRRRATAGATQAVLAAEFGVSQAAMGRALIGATWTECPVPPVASRRTGEKHAYLKLTPEMLAEAQRRHESGETVTAIAADLGVVRTTLAHALAGKTRAYRSDVA